MTTETLLWDFMVENGIATENELQLVSNGELCGYSEETMMKVLFCKTSFRSIEQAYNEGDYFFSNELLDRFGLDCKPDEEIGQDECETRLTHEEDELYHFGYPE